MVLCLCCSENKAQAVSRILCFWSMQLDTHKANYSMNVRLFVEGIYTGSQKELIMPIFASRVEFIRNTVNIATKISNNFILIVLCPVIIVQLIDV